MRELPGGEGEACLDAGALGRLGFRLSLWAGGAPQTAGRVPGTPSEEAALPQSEEQSGLTPDLKRSLCPEDSRQAAMALLSPGRCG